MPSARGSYSRLNCANTNTTDQDSISFSQVKFQQNVEHQLFLHQQNQQLKIEAPKTDEMIIEIIDNIWEKYDTDHNGYIDKEEFYFFMKDMFGDDISDLMLCSRSCDESQDTEQ